MEDFEAMSKVHNHKIYQREQRHSRLILLFVYNFGRFLGIVNAYWDRQHQILRPLSRLYWGASTIFRLVIVITYWDVIPELVQNFFTNPRSFEQLFSLLQIVSVVVFSVGLVIMKIRDGAQMITMTNKFVELNKQVAELNNTPFTLTKRFVILFTLKTIMTLMGYISEMPHILSVDGVKVYSFINISIGIYLWLGSMYILDGCYIGFMLLAMMYSNLGKHLQRMLANMKHIESASHLGSSLTDYNRMKLLCDYSEKLDYISSIYSRLYKLTNEFVSLFQWNILYYIYYNFMVIFFLLVHCIWQYLKNSFVDVGQILYIFVKIANLAFMIMRANDTVDCSEMVNQLNLDVVCSDIDVRWDTSVETFLSQRKVENLEIKVFGFFTLNNEFILMMLSAIITYLFFIIQFSMSGGFGTSNVH
ncbi:gustatory receptor 93a [Haematobia irritans]|uniref:gustatory receptor 93a n=1 Tax=Haematobia irritans TaxID=7368 RepID=UPI003F5032FD